MGAKATQLAQLCPLARPLLDALTIWEVPKVPQPSFLWDQPTAQMSTSAETPRHHRYGNRFGTLLPGKNSFRVLSECAEERGRALLTLWPVEKVAVACGLGLCHTSVRPCLYVGEPLSWAARAPG